MAGNLPLHRSTHYAEIVREAGEKDRDDDPITDLDGTEIMELEVLEDQEQQ